MTLGHKDPKLKGFSAKTVFTRKQALIAFALLSTYITAFLYCPRNTAFYTLVFFNTIYLIITNYKLYLIAFSCTLANRQKKGDMPFSLPRYSVIVPLYREKKVIKSLVKSLSNLNYERRKLEILLVTEEDDLPTIKEIKKQLLPAFFKLIIVPKSFPRTKAKACNYALNYITGKYVTIYDAEDRPDRNQLLAALQKFANSDSKTVCVQARLSFYNKDENWLTSMFAIEYELLFNYTLPSVNMLGMPILLGGSSNHFKAEILKGLGGWDPYNVTEDAELGLRIAAAGYKTTMIDSYTPEEATLSINSWLKQRTRWLKGHIHTYLCYLRSPKFMVEKFTLKGWFFVTQALFLVPMLLVSAPLVLCLSALTFIDYYMFTGVKGSMLNMLTWLNLFYGLAASVCTAYAGAQTAGTILGKKYFLTYPVYLLLHIIASILASYKLFKAPHQWEKTSHGITKISADTLETKT